MLERTCELIFCFPPLFRSIISWNEGKNVADNLKNYEQLAVTEAAVCRPFLKSFAKFTRKYLGRNLQLYQLDTPAQVL